MTLQQIIPNHPGQLCAFGFLFSDARVDLQRTVQMTSKKFDAEKADKIIQEMKKDGLATLKEQGYDKNIEYYVSVKMRYLGQNFELNVPISMEHVTEENKNMIWDSFNALHEERYGFKVEDEIMEIVNFEVTIISVTEKPTMKEIPSATGTPEVKDVRKVIYEEGTFDTNVYDRYSLKHGHEITGPALIEENASVTVVMPNQKVTVDKYGNVHVACKEA